MLLSESAWCNNEVDFGYPRTAHDCSAVLYVIANMQECDTGLAVNFSNASENQIKGLIDILASKKGKLWVTHLNLSGSRLTNSSLQAIESAVRSDMLAKLEWLILVGSLTSDAGTNASFVEACSAHCPSLQHLDLSYNNLGIPGASAISQLLAGDHPHTITHIYLYKTNLGDKGLTNLVDCLEFISYLELADNDIHASGVSCLADAVCSGKLKKMEWLVLSDNPLGLEGTVAVGRMVSSRHCRLQGVSLRKCGLTTVGFGLPNTGPLNLGTSTISCEALGQQLCQMPQNSTIASLNLDGNSFTGEGIHILAGFMHLCPLLKRLFTRDCGITSDDLIRLLDKLTQLSHTSKLRDWYLSNNQIDDRGVSALMDHLPSLFPHLGCKDYDYISLSNNPISAGMKKRFQEELIERCEELEVSYSMP